jgi:hypothetical protein
VPAGEHLINLALVSAIRLGSHQVHVAFAGLPRLARAFSYAEAGPLLEQLQQTGVLPIDALQEDRPRDPDDAAAAAGDSTPNGGPATGRRRRFGAWLARRRG